MNLKPTNCEFYGCRIYLETDNVSLIDRFDYYVENGNPLITKGNYGTETENNPNTTEDPIAKEKAAAG